MQLARRGYNGVGVEPSSEAYAEAIQRIGPFKDQISLVKDPAETAGSFDWVITCEVLEHLTEDLKALRTWADRLRPGGRILVSVPAHPERWGPSDEWAGHVRRYRRDELAGRVREAGLEVELLWCYGFPLANWVEPIGHAIHRRKLAQEASKNLAQRTARSGVERESWVHRLAGRVLKPELLLPFCWIQMPFLHTDWGNGFLLLGRKE